MPPSRPPACLRCVSISRRRRIRCHTLPVDATLVIKNRFIRIPFEYRIWFEYNNFRLPGIDFAIYLGVNQLICSPAPTFVATQSVLCGWRLHDGKLFTFCTVLRSRERLIEFRTPENVLSVYSSAESNENNDVSSLSVGWNYESSPRARTFKTFSVKLNASVKEHKVVHLRRFNCFKLSSLF